MPPLACAVDCIVEPRRGLRDALVFHRITSYNVCYTKLLRKADLKNLQKAEMPFGGLAAIPPRAMKRIYVSPGPTYDPEGREGSHWRWEKAFFAAGFRPGDIVQNTFSYHFSPGGMMFDDGLLRIGCTVIRNNFV